MLEPVVENVRRYAPWIVICQPFLRYRKHALDDRLRSLNKSNKIQ